MSQREEERGEARRESKVQKSTLGEWLRPVCPGAIAQTSKVEGGGGCELQVRTFRNAAYSYVDVMLGGV